MEQSREEAERIHGPLERPPFLVTDNGPSFIARRFSRMVAEQYSHVRIQSWAAAAKAKLERLLEGAA